MRSRARGDSPSGAVTSVITALRASPSGTAIRVERDGAKWLRLPVHLVADLGLVSGEEMDGARVAQIEDAAALERLWEAALRYAVGRGRSRREVVRRLRDRRADEDQVDAVLERLRTPAFSRRGFVRQGAARGYTAELIKRFDIRGATPETRTRLLSGGNMQKLILGRVLSNGPRFVLANQPTRGLDEGAIAAVHAELLAARAEGAAILLISEELEEAVALSDRIQAIVKGRLSEPISADEADPQRLGLMMAGVWTEDDHAA